MSFWVFLILAGLVVLVLRKPTGRIVAGHSHGAGKMLLRHEGGHLAAAAKIGVRVTSATVSKDSGLVSLHRADVARMSSRDYMAFMLSGQAAAGSVGCSADMANVRAEQKRMRDAGATPAEVRAAVRGAKSDANRYGRSSAAAKWASRLGERGKL